ncbi:sensor domain-containing phosphodiesterase [Microlunatus flavus]|uniref:EAL domain, c-di-GMP-specific phosphodiesterase class I (Or its enzymatically inactive variant) n=1 Tax=Microlunatus flavus TaxID=1036181 RepID=A0A1H9AMV3_9ACTN|nr:EAL domain-containing protein [Microlunatus flavus]SEP78142.1 EAL domain, c-di-GMP-specific phosphodiesterase class I (or its enzymatically inactive variant) [Microlunatus flavus]
MATAQRLAKVAALALGFDHGTVLLPDGTTADAFPPRPRAARELDRQVLASGEALVVERAGAEQAPLGAYVGLPVSCEDQVLSVLSVSDELGRTVSRRDLSVLLELAELWSVALCRDLADAPPVDPVAVDLARGLQRGEVVPWYQPVVDLVSGQVVGVEALARWRRAPGVVEPPSVFVPVAERSDLILDVDLAVMRQAFADLAGWQAVRPGFWVTTNLSARHLAQEGWTGTLQEAAATAGVDPASVILELTETAAPADEASSRVVVDAMRGLGYHVWFDDFGSGWSALSDLGRFPVDGIKIDRSYADQLGTKTGEVVVRALVSAAAELGLSVTIEGIETASQYERARNLGCHFAQGYLWSRPVPPAAIARWV